MATGTDTGVTGVLPGMVAREIALLHDHGLSALDAIRAGTSAAARLLGTDADATGTDIYERRSDGTLHVVSFGPTAPTYLGENADGSVVFATPDNNATLGDNDGLIDLYLRRHDGTLLLLTPGTASAVTWVIPNVTPSLPHIPSDQGRVVFDSAQKLIPTDTDTLTDAYEATANGLRLLATSPGQTQATPAQTVDGSRVLFNTFDGLVGADTGGNEDIYEADYAVPVLSGIPTLRAPASSPARSPARRRRSSARA